MYCPISKNETHQSNLNYISRKISDWKCICNVYNSSTSFVTWGEEFLVKLAPNILAMYIRTDKF